ncbi:MAG: YjbH domain-containing protein, partial [Terriglobus sp.]
MRSTRYVVLVLSCLVTGRALYAQAHQDTGLSLQGYTGVLNTPNAHVQQDGTLDVLYSNQREPIRGGVISPWQDNYFFSLGMFPFLEFGGRLTNNISAAYLVTGGGTRDLSLNAKVSSAPWTARYRFAPTLAVGAADPGEGHHFFQTTYVVGSANPVSWLRLSAGYGKGPDRMKGGFAGGELRVFDWATILADYDTRHTNVGARLTAPELPFIRARLTATLSAPVQSSNPQKLALAGGFIIPLNFKERKKHTDQESLWSALSSRRQRTPAPQPVVASRPAYDPDVVPAVKASVPQPVMAPVANANPISLQVLRERLIKNGFVNVRVGQQDKTLVVVYENIRYNHSELDAIGVVLGLASQVSGGELDDLRMVIRRKGLALIQVEGNLAQLYNWLEGNRIAAAPPLSITQDVADEKWTTFVSGSTNPGMFKPSLVVYPSLTTLIGTEHGLFDYQLSIRPELQVPLWRGATAVTRADIPVSWSPNLAKGAIYAAYRTPTQLDRAMLFQAVPLAPGLVAN